MISYSSTPYDILGEMFKLNYKLLYPCYYSTNHTQAGLLLPDPVYFYFPFPFPQKWKYSVHTAPVLFNSGRVFHCMNASNFT